MTIEIVEPRGERFVILSEKDFLDLQQKIGTAPPLPPSAPVPQFREIEIDGQPASELLIRDRG